MTSSKPLYTSENFTRSYLEPASVEEELQQSENWDVHVQIVILVSFLRVQELSANHTEGKKRINC